MIQITSIITVLAALAAASPLGTNKGPWSDEDISMCLSAPNCYIEDTGTSTEIRLNTTHELTGVAKRAAGPHTTKITIGKNMINYGEVGAGDSGKRLGAMHRLWNICDGSGQCDTTPYPIRSLMVFSKQKYDQNAQLILHAQATYPDGAYGGAFVEALQVAAAKNEKCTTETVSIPIPKNQGGGYDVYDFNQCTGASFHGITSYITINGDPVLQGFMNARVDQVTNYLSFTQLCAVITGTAGSIAGALSAGTGALLGGISALCGAS